MPLRVLHVAEQEVEEAKDWYAARNPGLPSRLTDAFEESLNVIAAGPSSHANHPRIADSAVRFVTLRSFPYIVLYRDDAAETLVLAVVHVR